MALESRIVLSDFAKYQVQTKKWDTIGSNQTYKEDRHAREETENGNCHCDHPDYGRILLRRPPKRMTVLIVRFLQNVRGDEFQPGVQPGHGGIFLLSDLFLKHVH